VEANKLQQDAHLILAIPKWDVALTFPPLLQALPGFGGALALA
jgi:hypothetical protein